MCPFGRRFCDSRRSVYAAVAADGGMGGGQSAGVDLPSRCRGKARRDSAVTGLLQSVTRSVGAAPMTPRGEPLGHDRAIVHTSSYIVHWANPSNDLIRMTVDRVIGTERPARRAPCIGLAVNDTTTQQD